MQNGKYSPKLSEQIKNQRNRDRAVNKVSDNRTELQRLFSR